MVDASTLDKLYEAVRGPGGEVHVRRNGEVIAATEPSQYGSLASQLRYGRYDDRVRSISLEGRVTLYLGPNTVYTFARSKRPLDLAALWEVHEILRSARWKPGYVLYRSWGGAAALLAILAIGWFSNGIEREAGGTVVATVGAAALYLTLAFVSMTLWRVRFRLQGTIESTQRFRSGLYTIFVALISAAVGAAIQGLFAM